MASFQLNKEIFEDNPDNKKGGNGKFKLKLGSLNITELENIYLTADFDQKSDSFYSNELKIRQEGVIRVPPSEKEEEKSKTTVLNKTQTDYTAEKNRSKVENIMKNLALPRVEKPGQDRTSDGEAAQVVEEDTGNKHIQIESPKEVPAEKDDPKKEEARDKKISPETETKEIEKAPLEKKIKKPIGKKEATREKPVKKISEKGKNEQGLPIKYRGTRFSIKAKLLSIISLIIFSLLTAMILLATNFFKQSKKVGIDERNLNLTSIIAQKVKSDFSSMADKARLLAAIVSESGRTEAQKQRLTRVFFENDKELMFLGIAENRGGSIVFAEELVSESFLSSNQLTMSDIRKINSININKFTNAFSGQAIVQNLSQGSKIPIIGIGYPFQKRGSRYVSILILYMKLESMLTIFQAGAGRQAFMVNPDGSIIAHSDLKKVFSSTNLIDLPIVKKMLTSKVDNGKIRYLDKDKLYYLGAFKKIGFAGLGIVITAEERKAYQEVYSIQRRNFYILVIGLNIAILITYFFAKSITDPIVKLVGATKKIEEGQYQLGIRPTTRDEIGDLTNSFLDMGKGLEEREKMKDAFGKFVNKDLAELAMKGEIKLGGEKKTCAIFFSDIRGFTAISESMEPEEVVEFLNEYMTAMVKCINDTQGVVDKFIGDAIMAHWGALVARDNDTESAVNAALSMRKALLKFNSTRGSEKKPIIKFGCGINTGPVISGQIGSDEKLEFTVIGDAVNLASRVETLNKPFGTDILITADSLEEVKDIYNCEEMPAIKVKGKSKPQTIYAVLGKKDDPNCPKSMDEVRKIVGIDFDSSKQIKADEKEVKYEILG